MRRFTLILLIAALFGFSVLQAKAPASPDGTPARVPVIVELFTSEGCSDCPPADALVRKLEETQPVPNVEIIVLSEHVDYWNHIGWTDRFSSKTFTERQQKYGDRFKLDSVYTPQMVVDGRTELNGADERRALKAIADAAKMEKTEITVNVAKSGPEAYFVTYGVDEGTTARDAELTIAVTESGLETQVHNGENKGRTLYHTGVVRYTKQFPVSKLSVGGALPLKLDPSWKEDNLRVVAYLQNKADNHILGATTAGLSSAADNKK
jgi:hypothetical protein